MLSITQVRVRFAETDAAGIVHYAQYLAYLEAGRSEALRTVGVSSEMIASCSLHAPVLEAVMRYRSPAHFDDLLEVHSWIADVLNTRFRFAYEIQRAGDGVVIATGETLHMWTEPGVATDTQLPRWLIAALDQLRA